MQQPCLSRTSIFNVTLILELLNWNWEVQLIYNYFHFTCSCTAIWHDIVSWEQEGHYCHILCTAIVPFWFSMEHLWAVITPFWLSTDDMYIALSTTCQKEKINSLYWKIKIRFNGLPTQFRKKLGRHKKKMNQTHKCYT